MESYDPKKIELKWQKYWSAKKLFQAKSKSTKPKYYPLVEFPYPSGEGLHVGHPRPYIGMDIIARKRRAEGFNVLYPMGWDAFGLPAENYAIKTGIQPAITTKKNIDNFRKQMQLLGLSFDWSREVDTTDPKYYKWTQWIFLQFLKAGLAYKSKAIINWCPKDKIGLANEEVINGKCERCGTPVEKREKEQWMLAITKYADRLDKDLDTVNYQEKIKLQQRNWIGKSEGAEISFQIILEGGQQPGMIRIFTTRPDTIFGATYMVLSPEHPWVTLALDENHKSVLKNADAVRAYVEDAKNKDEFDRTAEGKEKTGIELKGARAINPATKEEIPIFVADYVLAHYGTGAIMAVPAHDLRDFEFVKKFKLPIKQVVKSSQGETTLPFVEDGIVINSEGFSWANGLLSRDARTEIIEELDQLGIAKAKVRFKLRDWVFSRQRYWGEPIPVIHCSECGVVPVPEKDLPVMLPKVKNYEPTDSGESPLASISSWVNVKCPICKMPAKRETDTMPNWAGSSWYFLRYTDPKNKNTFAGMEALRNWMPVDWYNGDTGHTTLHLLYSRFWNKFLFDQGLVPVSEPYMKRTSHGHILGEGGEKMSKSKGNVVNPDEIVKLYGADTLRMYEMFMGPFGEAVVWSTESIIGPRRFIERVWKLGITISNRKKDEVVVSKIELETTLNKTIQKVSDDIEAMGFNTAVSAMMIFLNVAEKNNLTKSQFESFLKLLAPFAPHIAEDLWSKVGNKTSITFAPWPIADRTKMTDTEVSIAVQVDGKVRAVFKQSVDTGKEESVKEALSMDEVKKWIADKPIKRTIFVKNRLINFVL